MYADTNQVTELCANVKSGITPARVTAAAAFGDAMIDAKLKEYFYWPVGQDGTDHTDPSPPAIIVNISSLLAAARIESAAYAHNEAGGAVPNPYASSLKKDAMTMLKDLCNGAADIVGIERRTVIKTSRPAKGFELSGPLSGHASRNFGRRQRTR